MRSFAIALAGIALIGAGSAAVAGERMTGEERLAKLLEGREAGKPVSCIGSFDNQNMQIIDKTALVYGRGEVVYVNRPDNAEKLDDDDILVTYPTGSQLCRLDRVNTIERSGHFVTGFIMLGDFVPYRRVAKTN